MQYTDKYKLVLIDGTDTISRVPHNESMTKIDEALGDMATDVAESVASVNKVKTQIEQEMSDFSTEMQETLDNTVAQINTNVNDRLAATPRYQLALGMDFPRGYNIGGETGNNDIPISDYEFAKTWNMTVKDNNSFYNNSPLHTDGVLGKVSLDICVENNEENGDIEISLVRQVPGSSSVTVNSRLFSLVGGRNTIHFETVTNINYSMVEPFYFEVKSNERKTLIGKQYLTVERIGL